MVIDRRRDDALRFVYADRAMQMSGAESPVSPLAILSRCLLSLRKDTYGIT